MPMSVRLPDNSIRELATGATGVIVGGPVRITSDGVGYTWWQVQWFDGNGTVDLYINGSKTATTNAGPTGGAAISYPIASLEIVSSGSSTQGVATLQSMGILI